jgi:spermidine synthase
MKPFEEIDRHTSAEGKVLRFMHRDGDYWILIDDEELMATRATHSERELALRTCADLAKAARPRVLIGGLGLGFTLRAALDVLPRQAEVVVAEVFDCVVRWNYEHLPELQGDALRDPRLGIARCDVWDAIGGSLGDPHAAGPRPASSRRESGFDVILLDVDNGPAATCLDANARLYGRRGIERIKKALRPGGLLAVWATDPDAAFERRLRAAGFEAHTEAVRSRGSRGTRHQLFLARLSEPRAGSVRQPKSKRSPRRSR